MTNRHTTYLHGDFLDGDLSPAETARVEQHLATCGPCREDLERLKRLTSTLRKIETPDPGDDYFDNLLDSVVARTASIERESKGEAPSLKRISETKRMLQNLIRLAAAVTLLFVAFYISDFNQRQKSTGWTERFTQGEYVSSPSEPIEPFDYLPAGNTMGIPFSGDTTDITVEESSDTDMQDEF
jgi:hypothetical protein